MPDFTMPPQLSVWDVFLRMFCAMAVGAIIGIEREYSKHPAGMRTHILVALGACAVMVTGEMIYTRYYSYGSNADPARLAAQVITGVGFLGTGTILREGPTVRGLTTAASLWAVACLGIAAGGGFFSITLVGMVFILITLTLFELLQNRMIVSSSRLAHYKLETQDIHLALDALNHHVGLQKAAIQNLRVTHQENSGYQAYFLAEIGGFHAQRRSQLFLEGLARDAHISSVSVSHNEESTFI